jgi:hypothetical protein
MMILYECQCDISFESKHTLWPRVGVALRRLVMNIATWVQHRLPPKNELARFFPVRLILTVIISVGFLSFSWYAMPSWRPFLIPIGTTLGALFSAVPGLISERMGVRWFYAVLGCILVGLVTWFTTMDMANQLDAKRDELASIQSRYNLLNNDLRRYARASDGQVILEAAKILRDEWRNKILASAPAQRDYTHADEIIKLISEIDPNNGHALYYEGESKRKRGVAGSSQHDFLGYLEIERNLPEDEKGGSTDPEVCYQRPKGYCKQRTAWIQHLLAKDYYKTGRAETDREKKRDAYQLSLRYARAALSNYPGGFYADGQGSTVEMERDLVRELKEMEQTPERE